MVSVAKKPETISENKHILREFRGLLQLADQHLTEDKDLALVKKAFRFAAKAHEGMRRKTGEPYILHPLYVARVCVGEMNLGATAIAGAFLHDVVEDTEYELEDIERNFGKTIADIIDGLTKISEVTGQTQSLQAENFRKILLSLSRDIRVIFIKLADRLHNLRTLETMPRTKQLKIVSESYYIYAPIAHRLGLYNVKSEMEDIWLSYAETADYQAIVQRLQETRASREQFIEEFTAPIQRSLDNLGIKASIKSRTKSIYSIWRKMQRTNVSFDEIFDIFAIRIIIREVPRQEEKAACWRVYSAVTDYYRPNPDRLRDWISNPKSNGYESLHTTVMSNSGAWVEVQIRTKRMDEIAERGYAAHWNYKEKGDQTMINLKESAVDQWLTQVRDMMEHPSPDAVEVVNDVRKELTEKEVYIFTPKGDVKVMPKGATALDFAFEIHTEIGLHTLSAKTNHKLVPLSYELQNGDQVEILTSQKQKPNRDWLYYVKTSKATKKIKEAVRDQEKAESAEGREILERKLATKKAPFNEQILEELREHFGQPTITDLYMKVAHGNIAGSDITKYLKIRERRKKDPNGPSEPLEPPEEEIQLPRTPSKDETILIGDDMQDLDYRLASCCNPIPGDEVLGFVTVGKGITVHRTSCPNAIELMSKYSYRVLRAKWTNNRQLAFLTELKISGSDRIGMLSDIVQVISADLRINIKNVSVGSGDGIFEGKISLFVENKEHLEKLNRQVEKIPGVFKVVRDFNK